MRTLTWDYRPNKCQNIYIRTRDTYVQAHVHIANERFNYYYEQKVEESITFLVIVYRNSWLEESHPRSRCDAIYTIMFLHSSEQKGRINGKKRVDNILLAIYMIRREHLNVLWLFEKRVLLRAFSLPPFLRITKRRKIWIIRLRIKSCVLRIKTFTRALWWMFFSSSLSFRRMNRDKN